MMTRALPEVLTGPAAWAGSELQASPEKWLVHLSAPVIAEREHAARYFLAIGHDIGEITMADFPLPGCAGHLADLREKLIHGIGFEVLRGLPVDTYSQEMAATIFCGVGAHLGCARSQNALRHILGHVRNLGVEPNDPNARIYQTSARQNFHTDSADVVGLLCLREAGGRGLSAG